MAKEKGHGKMIKPGLFCLATLISICAQAQDDSIRYVTGSTTKITQLVGDYDRDNKTPTQNRTEENFGLISTDLGVPFQHLGRTYILFGDTWGESGGDAIGYTTDINPEDGLSIQFITGSTGTYKPLEIMDISQGDFEVPMEGVSVNSKIFIYHTTDHTDEVVMGKSVVAVSEDDGLSFNYLYDLSDQHFINVSVSKVNPDSWSGLPNESPEGLIIFGSGEYRKSDVRLAFQPTNEIETSQSLRYFSGIDTDNNPIWSEIENDAAPLFSHSCVGELSVTYNAYLQKWLMLYNGDTPRGVIFRTADQPWGPWTEPQLLFDPWLDNGYCHFMHVSWEYDVCDSISDPQRENEWGGEYGPYQFESLATGNDTSTTIYYTLSTWNPYTVVLMKSTLSKEASSSPNTIENGDLNREFPNLQVYPNPFRNETIISFTLLEPSRVELQILSVEGKAITTIANRLYPQGLHSSIFDGSLLESGVYICNLKIERQTLTSQILIVR